MEDDSLPGEAAPLNPRLEVAERDGQLALVVDGVVQSVAVVGLDIGRGYWPAMLPDEPPRSALILGLGGGTIAHLIHLRFGSVPIVGVDDDPLVLATGRDAFGLASLPNLRVEVTDAYAFAATCRDRFDLVVVDLFRGGQVPRGVTATLFLRDVRRLLTPGGLATFNLVRDGRAASRIHRLAKVFLLEKQVLTGFNVVVHCRPPARMPRLRTHR